MIDQTIDSLLKQETHHTFEIIVVGMDKFGLLDPYAGSIRILETDQPTPPGSARNLGAEVAQGDYLLFIDADCIASPHWLDNHLKHHTDANSLNLVGGGVTFPSAHYLTLAENVSSFHEYMTHLPEKSRTILPSLNLSISKKGWEALGGFIAAPTGEDIDFSFRAGLAGITLIFDPKAVITHLPNRRYITQIFNHTYQFGKNSIKTNRQYWDTLHVPFVLRHWLLTLLTAPLLSTGVILKMIFKEKLPTKYWHTLPVVFLLKIAWCLGCASRLKAQMIESRE